MTEKLSKSQRRKYSERVNGVLNERGDDIGTEVKDRRQKERGNVE